MIVLSGLLSLISYDCFICAYTFIIYSNDAVITRELIQGDVRTKATITEQGLIDLVLATITVKYTQVRGHPAY
jgi:hypothetical protein